MSHDAATIERPAPIAVPATWDGFDPYHACDLCDHHIDVGGVRHCTCTNVVLPGRSIPVETARKPYGTCGVDAKHLSFPGLRT